MAHLLLPGQNYSEIFLFNLSQYSYLVFSEQTSFLSLYEVETYFTILK